VVIWNCQGYRVGWTQADTYDAVNVSAKLTSSGAANQTGRAFLTTQIGPGTSTNNEIASGSFTFPLQLTNVTLFEGLYLPPGPYYLSIIGDSSNWGSCWETVSATNLATGPDVVSLGGFGASGGLNAYFPATSAYSDLAIPPKLTIQGIDLTHPVLQITLDTNLVSISWSTNVVGFDLESASSLLSANWQPITEGVATNSGQFVLTTNANGAQFFRLRKPSNQSSVQ
jgi:hypothetical protein